MPPYSTKMNEESQKSIVKKLYNMIQEHISPGLDVPSPGYGYSEKKPIYSKGVDASLVVLLYLKNGTEKLGALVECSNDAEAAGAIYETASHAKGMDVKFYTQKAVVLSREQPEVSQSVCDLLKESFPEMDVSVQPYGGRLGYVGLNPESGEWATSRHGVNSFALK